MSLRILDAEIFPALDMNLLIEMPSTTSTGLINPVSSAASQLMPSVGLQELRGEKLVLVFLTPFFPREWQRLHCLSPFSEQAAKSGLPSNCFMPSWQVRHNEILDGLTPALMPVAFFASMAKPMSTWQRRQVNLER